MSKKAKKQTRPKSVSRSGNPALAAQGKTAAQVKTSPKAVKPEVEQQPSASEGPPGKSSTASRTPVKVKLKPAIAWKEKIILSLTFTLGSLAVFWAINELRPHEGRAVTAISNLAFSTSGGFLAILLLLIAVNGIPRENRAKLDKKAFQKIVIMAVALLLAISGMLASFSNANPSPAEEDVPQDDGYVFGS